MKDQLPANSLSYSIAASGLALGIFSLSACNSLTSFTRDVVDTHSSSTANTYSPGPPGVSVYGMAVPLGVNGQITTVKVAYTETKSTSQTVTFGQVFAPGHVPANKGIRAEDSSGNSIPLQLDRKAVHADGSLRHGIITLTVPAAPANQIQTIKLFQTSTPNSNSSTLTTSSLSSHGYDMTVSVVQGGVTYTASALSAISGASASVWMQGALTTEWLASSPLVDSSGNPHPHLQALFQVRASQSMGAIRTSVTLENTWSYVASPGDQTYTVSVSSPGGVQLASTPVTHFIHSRWRKVFYTGEDPKALVTYDNTYLQSTRAVPHYDLSIATTDSGIQSFYDSFTASQGIMQIGPVLSDMSGTGGRPELGIFPAWQALFMITQDTRMLNMTTGMGDLAGTWSTHFRDEKTGYPITLDSYPYMTLAGNPSDTYNPATGKNESFPTCTSCTSPYAADTSHQPEFAYLPYLLTGDYYYLEELQFWASFNLLLPNPAYRGQGLGLFKWDQVRGQAWSLRSLAEAAYITPDSHALKNYFLTRLHNNIKYYTDQYPNNPSANKIGVLVDGYALAYDNNTGFAPWMDNFFTATLGHVLDLGFTEATSIAHYKAAFPVSTMMDPGFCWILSTNYYFHLVPTAGSTDYFTSLNEVWKNTTGGNDISRFYNMKCNSPEMASALLAVGFIPPGYGVNTVVDGGTDPEGYGAVMQAALAYAVDMGMPSAVSAWNLYGTRANKATYTNEPQFALVPTLKQ